MDFFAQTYNQPNNEGRHFTHPTHSIPPRTASHEGAAKGYGCEANAHLRRASSGLELDVGPRHNFMFSHFHHQNPDRDGEDVFSVKNPQKENGKSIIHDTELATTTESVVVAPKDVDSSLSKTTSVATPRITRRASVSNPCLLHHTNTDGRGTVRAPVMPLTMSSQPLDDTPQAESYGPLDDSCARPRRSFSLTIESMAPEGR